MNNTTNATNEQTARQLQRVRAVAKLPSFFKPPEQRVLYRNDRRMRA